MIKVFLNHSRSFGIVLFIISLIEIYLEVYGIILLLTTVAATLISEGATLYKHFKTK